MLDRMTGLLPRKEHRHLFWLWVRRAFRARYAGSVGGTLWAILLPVLTIALYFTVFSVILQIRIPELATADGNGVGFLHHLLSGLLPWLAISEGVGRGANALVANQRFLSKQAFPVEILPMSAIVISVFPQLIGMVLLLMLLAFNGALTVTAVVSLPVLIVIQLFLVSGVALFLAVVAVHIRDVVQVLPVVLQFLFYTAPIIYAKSLVPEGYRWLMLLNPVTGLIDAYHSFLLGLPVEPQSMAALAFWTALLGGGGLLLFRRLKPSVGDVL